MTQPLFPWLKKRFAGVLLHPTSLPSEQGIGTLGKSAYELIDFLESTNISYWQICPLGPTGFGDSPYQCFSAFAGNPYLIDLFSLVSTGLLKEEELSPLRTLPRDHVDYARLYGTFFPILEHAYYRFKEDPTRLSPYGNYCAFKKAQEGWLLPYATFQALKSHFLGKAWNQWPSTFQSYKKAKKTPLLEELQEAIEAHCFYQFLFYAQWQNLRTYANKKGIGIIGDLPLFVSLDSADVWTHPEIFTLDENGRPTAVAGVPPDYFSPTGQLWGNPLYNWNFLKKTQYAWWIDRLENNFDLYDVIRLDHFRGFQNYWAVPYGAPNAINGTWEHGPSFDFFRSLKRKFPNLPLIVEDLGEIDTEVIKLREKTGLPGMAILQFAFGSGSDNFYLPYNLTTNCVVYPGTHDNDTVIGWYESASEKVRDEFRRYSRSPGDDPHWDMIHAAYKSVCNLAIVSMQDIMGLGSEGRMNTPGKIEGNWQWRYTTEQFEEVRVNLTGPLFDLVENAGRKGPKSNEMKRICNRAEDILTHFGIFS